MTKEISPTCPEAYSIFRQETILGVKLGRLRGTITSQEGQNLVNQAFFYTAVAQANGWPIETDSHQVQELEKAIKEESQKKGCPLEKILEAAA